MYGKMLDAKTRVHDKYGLNREDSDVEIIIDCLLDISRYLASRMYDYGEKSALETQKNQMVAFVNAKLILKKLFNRNI